MPGTKADHGHHLRLLFHSLGLRPEEICQFTLSSNQGARKAKGLHHGADVPSAGL